MASFGDQSRGQASSKPELDQTAERGLSDKSVSARIEFEVWRSAFQRSHASWANAPAELRPMMLLSGPALVRAEGWLINFPDKLSVSERRFVKQSLAEKSTSEDVAFGSGPETLSIVGGMWVVAFAVVVSMFGPFLPGLIRQAVLSALPEEVREIAREGDRSKSQTGVPKPQAPSPAVKSAPPPMEHAKHHGPGDETRVIPALNAPVAPARDIKLLSAKQLMERAELRLEQKDRRAALLLAVEAAYLDDRDGVSRTSSSELVAAASLVAQGLSQQVGAGPQPAISPTVATVLFCDGGRSWIAAGADGFLQVAGQGFAKKLTTIPRRSSPLQGVSASSDCRLLAVPGEDYVVGLWSIETGQRVAEFSGHIGTLLATAFRADGLMVVSASQDSSARVWDTRTGRLKAVLEGHDREVVSAAFSPDGQRVVTGSKDGSLRVWTLGQQVKSIKLAGHVGAITQGHFSPDGAAVLSTSVDGFAALWVSGTGEQLRQIESEGTAIQAAEFSPDGRRIVTLTQEGLVQVWDRNAGQLLFALDTGEEPTRRFAFAPDGLRLLTTSWQGEAMLWDGPTGKLIAKLNGKQDRVEIAAFAGDGATAVGLLSQGAMVSWPVYGSSLAIIEAGKTKAGDCLTGAERLSFALGPNTPAWCGTELQP
jgi:WD40 repeat protein